MSSPECVDSIDKIGGIFCFINAILAGGMVILAIKFKNNSFLEDFSFYCRGLAIFYGLKAWISFTAASVVSNVVTSNCKNNKNSG